MAGVPSGLTAMPYFWVGLVATSFGLVIHQIIPIFIATIVSYVFAAGCGGLHFLAEGLGPKPKGNNCNNTCTSTSNSSQSNKIKNSNSNSSINGIYYQKVDQNTSTVEV